MKRDVQQQMAKRALRRLLRRGMMHLGFPRDQQSKEAQDVLEGLVQRAYEMGREDGAAEAVAEQICPDCSGHGIVQTGGGYDTVRDCASCFGGRR